MKEYRHWYILIILIIYHKLQCEDTEEKGRKLTDKITK